MTKSFIAMATLAAVATVSAQTTVNHISFTQPVGDGITFVAGTNQTLSWTMACVAPSTLISATPDATEVDFMDSNNFDNAFFVKKVGTIDCTKSVGNLVWTVPADTKPGVYALQFLLTPQNAYSGRFNVTAPGGSPAAGSAAAAGSSRGSVGASGSHDGQVAPAGGANSASSMGMNVLSIAAGVLGLAGSFLM
ncbi:hypothetical protein BGZ51_006764 [Haplosporangium sp. Z 767]|nr:hypothetical protein BGZ51_006764 [Haplosporangium sp. Z 767]KAF9179847.1 hypothetical protein BGZ50_006658 [Haplosporangium sp. Z 11]